MRREHFERHRVSSSLRTMHFRAEANAKCKQNHAFAPWMLSGVVSHPVLLVFTTSYLKWQKVRVCQHNAFIIPKIISHPERPIEGLKGQHGGISVATVAHA